MKNINFKEYFWDKCEDLHKRYLLKNAGKGNILDLFTRLQTALRDFCKTINNIVVKDFPLFTEQYSTQNESLEYIKYIFTIHTTQFNVGIEMIKNQIIAPLKTKKEAIFKKEKELYNDFRKIANRYKDSLINLEKTKTKYYQTANVAEMSTKSAKSTSLKKLNDNIDKEQQNLINLLEEKSVQALNEAKKWDQKYTDSVKDANINRENYIKKQQELLDFYREIEYIDISEYKSLLLVYLSHLKTQNSIMKENLIQMDEKINKMNIEKDIKLIINKYASDKKPEEEIKYEMYIPKIDIKKCSKDEDYKLYFNTIVTMKSYIKILPDYDIDLESKKQEIRELCKIFFSLNLNYDENKKKRLLELLQEKWAHDFFLVILSKQRTNGRYSRSKNIINHLAFILNYFINFSQKSLNYMCVKNCIILSQTFFYEEDKKKIYLYNYIKTNKWVKTPNFWRGLIQANIDNEQNQLKQNSNNGEIKKMSIYNIIFSQVASYSSCMKDFLIDQRIIVKIIDEFMNKYGLPKELSDSIYNTIGDVQYVEKLRNEYISKPDLEQKILEEINKEENDEKKEEQKEEQNDEKKAENFINEIVQDNNNGLDDNNKIVNNDKINDKKDQKEEKNDEKNISNIHNINETDFDSNNKIINNIENINEKNDGNIINEIVENKENISNNNNQKINNKEEFEKEENEVNKNVEENKIIANDLKDENEIIEEKNEDNHFEKEENINKIIEEENISEDNNINEMQVNQTEDNEEENKKKDK